MSPVSSRLARAVALLAAGLLAPATAAPVAAAQDQFTPVTATPAAPTANAVRATDGRFHVVYELRLTNTKAVTATVRGVTVRDAGRPRRVVARYGGRRLLARLRTLAPRPAADARIPANEQRLLYVELSFARRSEIPRALVHTLRVDAADNPGATSPTPLRYRAARVPVERRDPVTLGSPLRGDGWVVVNGCCNADIVHRGAFQSVNGELFNAQRYAIDWIRIDANGRFFNGPLGDVTSHNAYGAEVLSVAPGRVVSTLSHLPDQSPGQLPDPRTITLQTVDGNHVVVDIGGGRYVFYAHLQRGSVTVKPGDRVRRGQVLGKLGNSGNTSAPHLHIHVMDRPSVLGSHGLPFVFDRFTVSGRVPRAAYDAADGIVGVFPVVPPRVRGITGGRFPLDLDVVSFP